MKNIVGIVSYGSGNIYNLKKTLKLLKVNYTIIKNSDQLSKVDRIILPGIGTFGHSINILKKNNLYFDLIKSIKSGIPVFAICNGLQLLFEKSMESPGVKGLSILKGEVLRMNANPIPHIGWSKLISADNGLKKFNFFNNFFYFANTYTCKMKNNYKNIKFNYLNKKYIGMIDHKNILGVQFHPELSGEQGIKVFNFFLKKNNY